MTWNLNHGSNTLSVSQSGYAVPTLYGRTLANLVIGGNCEDTSKWIASSCTITLDSSSAFVGANAFKLTITGATLGEMYQNIITKLSSGKYYVVIAQMKNGNATLIQTKINFTGGVGIKLGANVTGTNYTSSYVKVAPTDFNTATNAYLYSSVQGVTNQFAYVDGIRMYEISAADYALIGVDANYTGDKLGERFPYVDSVQHVQNPMITNGTDYIYGMTDSTGASLKLASSVDNTVRDILSLKDGFYRKTKNFVTDMILDGSLSWFMTADGTGCKQVAITAPSPIPNFTINPTVIKYDGKILSTTAFSAGDQVGLGGWSGGTLLGISMTDTDSGWGETFSPNTAEIQAFFYGWKLNNGTFGTPYNGTGIKTWTTIEATSNTGSITVVPTTQATLTTYTNYKLTYQLLTPTEEIVNVEGGIINLQSGGNQIEIGEGVVVRETVIPVLYSTTYRINDLSFSSSYLKYRSNRIVAVYKNGIRDYLWSIQSNFSASYGGAFAQTATANFDATSVYTVTYIQLDKYLTTSYATDTSIDLIRIGTKIDMSTLNISALTSYSRYLTLCTQATKTGAEVTEMTNLATLLDDYIVTASDYNSRISNDAVAITDNKIGVLSGLNTSDKSSITNATNEVNLKVSANAQITSLKREIAQLKLISNIKNRADGASSIFFNDFSGVSLGSVATLDTYKSTFTGALSAGASSGTIVSVIGLSIGREVTIQDVTTESIRERVVISNIVGNVASFSTPLINSYVNSSLIYRSISVVDTVNRRLKFSTSPILLLQEDSRYNITSPSSVISIVQWVDQIILTGFSTTSSASIVSSGANESFTSMTKVTANIDGLNQEEQFSYLGSSANTKITIRNTMNRVSTSDVAYENQITGAVG